MTEGELNKIEVALEIKLPTWYREFISPVSLPAIRGNTDTELWDDADALIKLNRELRSGFSSVKPWPANFFALGRDGGGSTCAIKVDEPEPLIFWADRCHLNANDKGQNFTEWANDFFEGEKTNLFECGGNLETSASEYKKLLKENAKSGCGATLIVAAIFSLMFIGGIFLLAYLVKKLK